MDKPLSSPQYGQQPTKRTQSQGGSFSSASRPGLSPSASGSYGSDSAINYADIVGKLNGWYRGGRYTVDELWEAVSTKNTSTVEKCLKAGLSTNYCRWIQDKTLGYGVRSIADVVAIRNDIKTMHVLLENNVDLLGAHVSMLTRHTSRIHFLQSVKELQVQDDDLWTTPLHEACKHNRPDMIDVLVGGGMDPNVLDNKRRTSLFLATKLQNSAVARQLLLGGANIELGKVDGVGPLANAAYAGTFDIVQLLLKHGARVDALDDRGETALYNAALAGNYNIMRTLAASGANVNMRNLDGASPFFLAASRSNIDAMDALIRCGADVDCPDINGCTALFRAVLGKNMLLLISLLNRGTDIDRINDSGWSPLYAAMIQGEDNIVRFLLTSGCDLSTPDRHGNSPLHQASMLNSVVAVRYMVDATRGRSIELLRENLFGETPLTLACKYDNSAVVKVLLKHGANPHYRDRTGLTALERAVYHGSYACAYLLIQANVEITYSTFQSLHQGSSNYPGSNEYHMMRNLLGQRYGNIPDVVPSPQLQSVLALATTREELLTQMRTMKKRQLTINPTANNSQNTQDQDDLDDPFQAVEVQVSASGVINHVTSPSQPSSANAIKMGVAAGAGAAVGQVVVNQVASNLAAAVLGL